MRFSLKSVVTYLVPLTVIGACAYWIIAGTPSLSFGSRCSTPVVYSMGSYDPRFGITEEEFRSATAEAAALWNTAAGKTLIAVSERPTVTVNLSYDERQEAAGIGKVISSEQAAYDAMKSEVEAVRARYAAATRSLTRAQRTYESRVDAYEERVAYWNDRGGAPPQTYQELETEKEALGNERARLGRVVNDINALVEDLQARVNQLNELAFALNGKVDVYNAAIGQDFDQGNYVEDKEGKRITVFEFVDRMELTRVLAHEFGHVLGIPHTEDPDSIMYSYNIGDTLVLTEADMAALAQICGS